MSDRESARAAVVRIDPRDALPALRTLFTQHDRPGSAAWVERACQLPLASDRTSWVRWSGDHIAAHVAALPSVLVDDGREVAGAVLCQLMAAAAHRDFFTILAVVKRAVMDLREQGAAFVMTNPSNAGAVAVMRAAGLATVATHGRLVYALRDARLPLDLLLRAHLQVRRLTRARVRAVGVPAVQAAEWTASPRPTGDAITARRRPVQYALRYAGFGAPEDLGFILQRADGTERGAAIVRCEPSSGGAELITLRTVSVDDTAPAIAAVAAAVRGRGMRRLDLLAVEGSPFSRQLVRGGCLWRREPWPIVALGLTASGIAAVGRLGQSDLERIDLD